jgi:hypothetical protein
MLGVDIQDELAILFIPISSTVENEQMINIRERVINLQVVDKRLALGGLQEEDVKIKLSRPPPKRISRVFAYGIGVEYLTKHEDIGL